jgi:hypothetical protein
MTMTLLTMPATAPAVNTGSFGISFFSCPVVRPTGNYYARNNNSQNNQIGAQAIEHHGDGPTGNGYQAVGVGVATMMMVRGSGWLN